MLDGRKPKLLPLIPLCAVVMLLGLQVRGGTRYLASNEDCQTPSLPKVVASVPPQQERPKKLADGCHHVFLDVGANLGVHARFLWEPEKYPLATMAKGWFDDAFGVDRDPRDFCVFAFEPNPGHKERLEGLAEAYAAMGWRYYPILAGISDEEGTLDFAASRDTLGRGFSARQSGQEEHEKKMEGKRISVPVKRLASWILEEIDDRILPDKVYGQYNTTTPKVVMKLDVETLEYVVLPDLLLSGALCKAIDTVFGEIHYQFFPLEFAKNGLTLTKPKEAKAYFKDQLRLLDISRHCKTTWIEEDDESHSEDGVPFPTLSSQEN